MGKSNARIIISAAASLGGSAAFGLNGNPSPTTASAGGRPIQAVAAPFAAGGHVQENLPCCGPGMFSMPAALGIPAISDIPTVPRVAAVTHAAPVDSPAPWLDGIFDGREHRGASLFSILTQTPAHDDSAVPFAPKQDAPMTLQDHSGAPAAAVPVPPGELRRQVEEALRLGDSAVVALGDAALAAATPDEKVKMLKLLLNPLNGWFYDLLERLLGGGGQTRSLNPIPIAAKKQRAILRIFATAGSDEGAFDRLYFRIGGRRLRAALSGARQREMNRILEEHHAPRPGDWEGYRRYLDVVTGGPSPGRSLVEFLVDGNEAIPKGVEALSAARRHIHLEVFQWEADEIGYPLARLLARKAREGVAVRVLVDQIGTVHDAGEAAKELLLFLQANGVDVIVNKAPLTREHLDHRKVLVVDGKVGFTGGMNVGRHYQIEWHDQQTYIEGPAVADLQETFLAQWSLQGGKEPAQPREELFPPLAEAKDGYDLRIVSHEGNGRDRNIKAAYLAAIGRAERLIRVATPYFSDEDMARALTAAARRGVRVQLVLPRENDQKVVQRSSRAYYEDFIEAGVEVYEYLGRMAHQKVAVIDGRWVTAGSSNLDTRSLEFNDELNYVCDAPEFAELVERKLFEVDIPRSERIWQYTPTLREKLDRMLSRWL